MHQDVVLVRTAAAPLVDLDRHRARDDVARRQILRRRRIPLHEALAFGVGEIAALAAAAFGHQAAGREDAGRVELHEFHVLAGEAGAERHAGAVAGAGMGGGAGLVGAAVAAGREHDALRAEAVDRAVLQAPRHHAAAGAVLHDEVEREVFDEELDVVLEALLIQRVQDGVAGAVGGGAGAIGRGLAVILHVAAERPLIDAPVLGAAERHAEMLQLIDGRNGLAAHVLDRVLVAEPVRTLDGVVHVPAPVVRPHVAERRADAALRGHGVAAGREHLGDAGGLQPRRAHAERRAQSRSAGADDDHVVGVIDDVVGARGRHRDRVHAPDIHSVPRARARTTAQHD